MDEVTQNSRYLNLDYQNDPIQHYDDITKTEMNINYLDHEPVSEMHPLATPLTNPHIALDFQSRDCEWCTEYFPNIQPIDPNLYRTCSVLVLYNIIVR